MKQKIFQTILLAGLIAGTMDIAAASIQSLMRGNSPLRMLKFIAGGLLGRDAALAGGLETSLLGLLLHFFIATTAAAVYCAASVKLPLLARQAIVCGPLYGIAVYFFMQLIVLPLSALRAGFLNQAATAILTGMLIHIFCVGLPIALVARWRIR